MTLKEIVKDKKARFKFYSDGELWYTTENGFEFPIPISDTGTGIFRSEENAITLMRWIRKHLEVQAEWKREREAQAANLPAKE